MTSKLIDVVAQLSSHDPDLTIYAVKPWTGESVAVLAREPDDGGLPLEARGLGADYFIEVWIASEFLDDWRAAERRPMSDREQCDRLIRYAVNDA